MREQKKTPEQPEQKEIKQINDAVRIRLNMLIDEKYRQFHSNLVPGDNTILGVRLPHMRILAKDIAKNGVTIFHKNTEKEVNLSFLNYLEAAATLQSPCYEEILLRGLVIGYASLPLSQRLPLIQSFVPHIRNWAVCDCFCSTLKFTNKHMKEMWSFLDGYLSLGIPNPSQEAEPQSTEYAIRFGVVMLLSYYIKEDYIDSVLSLLDSIQHEGYYVKMAVAWALSVCFVKFPEKTMLYFTCNHLDNFTYNKALQKTIESFRVDEGTKKILREMKRK